MTPETVAALREKLAKATPGTWKLWGMTVMADQTGSGNYEDAVEVAHTLYRDEHGKPRTFDASLICEMQRALPALLDAAEAHGEAMDELRQLADQAELALSLGMPAQTVTDLRAVLAKYSGRDER